MASGAGDTTTHIRLRLWSESDLTKVLSELNAKRSLQSVELVFSSSFNQKLIEDATKFMESVSRLPSLEQVVVTSDEEETQSYALQVRLLSTILDLAPGLEKLLLHRVELVGSIADFEALEESILNHSALTNLSSTSWLSEETRMTISMDHFVKAIAVSRSLQSVSFQPAFAFGGISNASAGMLCTLPALRQLDVACNLTDENTVAMAQALQSNTTLIELRLSCPLEEPGCQALASCITANAKLETLIIHSTTTVSDAQLTDSSSGVRNDPSSSSSTDSKEMDDEHTAQLALALKGNQNLKHFAIYGTKLSHSTQTAFVEMIKQNYTLESLSLLELRDDLQEEMKIYIRLNKCGRASLLGSSTVSKCQWVDTMSLVADELDCLFYLLGTKPSLCELNEDENVRKRGQRQTVAPIYFTKKSKIS